MKKMLLFAIGWLGCLQAQAQCSASFTAAPAPIAGSPYRVLMNDVSSYGSITGTQVSKRSIDYGDGSGNSSYSITHNYAAPGTYTIWLKISKIDSVTNSVFCVDSTSRTVVVNYPPCQATISETRGPGAGQVTYTANNLSGTPGVTYTWNFGDATPLVTGNPVTHTYSRNGRYTVRLYDTLLNTCTFTTTKSIDITRVPPNCNNLFARFDIGQNGSGVRLFNSSGHGYYDPSTALIYSWNFGDGTGSLDESPLHAYSTPGTYPIKLVVSWIDTFNNAVFCKDSITKNVTITTIVPPVTCNALTASFTSSVAANVASVTNTSTALSPVYNRYSYLSWGDNTPTQWIGNTTLTHTYAWPGTYNVKIITTWEDSIYQTYCTDSFVQAVTIAPLPARVGGFIVGDSTRADTNDYKVWLIQYDSLTNHLSAVDSLSLLGITTVWTTYNFTNVPAGTYLVKVAKTNVVPGSVDLVPTYHESSLYWHTARRLIQFGNGISAHGNIYMHKGTVTAGPGFIAGNVSLGANKGASNGVPGMTILLRGTNNTLVKAAQTDANGDFSFSNLPVGTYNVYPEEMNYATTPYANIVITGAQNNVANIDFRKDNALKNIKPGTTSVGNVPANTPLFTLYPNPAAHTINLEWKQLNGKSADILISDITGQVVLRQSVAVATATQQVDVRKLQTGIYFVKVITADSESTHKLVIQH